MSAALKTALLLVEHANTHCAVRAERRIDKLRRAEDLLLDDLLRN